MKEKIVTAAFIIIGDEILSGRTVDANLNFLALNLAELGVNLKEVRVVPDIESEIVAAVNALRPKYNYVFTSGGVGPTHDDITSAAIAKAFDDVLEKNSDAENLLLQYYGSDRLNPARLKMAYIPSRAQLLQNNIKSPSGFKIENVFVLAGIPKIFQALFEGAKSEIIGGKKTRSREIKTSLPEGLIAKDFAELQNKYPQVTMGSYPVEGATSLVFRSIDYDAIEKSSCEMVTLLEKISGDSIIEISKF